MQIIASVIVISLGATLILLYSVGAVNLHAKMAIWHLKQKRILEDEQTKKYLEAESKLKGYI
jgi:hypothetical protein